jgi:hypothetical protein
MNRFQPSYGFVPAYGDVTIPGTSLRLTTKSAVGFALLMGLGYGVYRYMRTA